MEAIKEFGKTVLSLDNCVIPNDRLLETPSSKDGVSHELEVDLRIVGCDYIQSAGLLLKLPQVAMATAQVLFQRFYYTKSFVKYSIQPLAMAAIFLAAKIEEQFRRLREVINVFHHLKQRRNGRPVVPMEYMGEEYFKTKSTVIKYERFLLKELGFCVHVKHPHKLVVTYLQMLDLHQSSLVQKAWNYMNDSLRTNVFVRYPPETIACACIFLAARQLKVSLPTKPAWWQLFGAKQKDLEAVSRELLALYSRPRKQLEKLEKEIAQLREKNAKKPVEGKDSTKTSSAPPSASGSPQATLKPADETKPVKSPLEHTTTANSKHSVKNGIQKSSPSTKKRRPSQSVDASPVRRIHSPIRVSESDSEHARSASPPHNGIPEHYRRDLDHRVSHKRLRHKHRERSEHKHSKSKHRSHDRSRDEERYYHEGRSRKRDHHDRSHYPSSKIRKIDSLRYR